MKKFKFIGNDIVIKTERVLYNEIRLKYDKISEQSKERFESVYINENRSLDDVIEKVNYQWGAIFSEEIEKVINSLIKDGFYNINSEKFVEQYCGSSLKAWDNAYKQIEEKYLSIMLNQEQQEEYRRQRKEYRGKWQGGGFGLEGAMKGAMQAGALNMTSGLIHSVANQFGNLHSNYQANKYKQGVFDNPDTLEVLSFGLENSIYCIGFAYMDFLEKNSNIEFDRVYKENREEALTILTNIKKVNISSSEKLRIIKELIELNPYEISIFEYAIDNFGDSEKFIFRIGNYFGHDLNEYKNKKLNDLLKSLPIKNEEQCEEARERIKLEAERLGFTHKNIEAIEVIEDKLLKLDIAARTVNSILFETREEANLARQEKEKIEKIMTEIKLINKNANKNIEDKMLFIENMEEAEKNILSMKNQILLLNCKTQIVNKYIDEVNEILSKIDINSRTLNETLYDSREDVKLIIVEQRYLDSVMDKVNYEDEENLKLAVNNIEKYEFKKINVNEQLEKLKTKLNEIDIELRTVDGVLLETRREAYVARIEKSTIEKFEAETDQTDEKSVKKLLSKIESSNFKTVIAENKIQELKTKLETMDREAKTVDGILFETREDATIAKLEKDDIIKSIQHLNLKSEEGLIDAKKIISHKVYKTKIGSEFIKEIEAEIQSIYTSIVKKASEYDEAKSTIVIGIVGTIVIPIVYLLFFLYSGFIIQIIIAFLFIFSVGCVFGGLKEMVEIKKAIAKVKKLRSEGKI